MATLEKGLHASPWWMVTVLGIPFAIAIWHFFAKLLPDVCGFLFAGKRIPQLALLALSSFTVFVFPFEAVVIYGYGEASHWISIFSACVLFPVVVALCWPRKAEHGARGDLNRPGKQISTRCRLNPYSIRLSRSRSSRYRRIGA